MNDVLNGMTREEAMVLVAGCSAGDYADDGSYTAWAVGGSTVETERQARALLALAALGASVVGAERMVWKDIVGMSGTHTVLVLKEGE